MPIPRPPITKLAETGTRDGTSSRATLSLGEVSLTRKMMVLWDETGNVAKHFLGTSRISRDSGGEPIRLERLLPAAHPRDPTLVASRVSILRQHKYTGPVGADPDRPGGRFPADAPDTPNVFSDKSVGANYFKAEIEVEYSRITYPLKEDAEVDADKEYLRYLDVGELEPIEDVLTLPGHMLCYLRPPPATPSNLPHTQPLGFNVPRINCVFDAKLIWKRLPSDLIDFWNPGPWLDRLYGDPWATVPIKSYIGTINKTKFGPYPAGTLLFRSWKPIRRPAPFLIYEDPESGSEVMTYVSPAVEWDIELLMRYDPQGHNRKYFSDPPPDNASRVGPGASGLYFVGRGNTYYDAGSVPDDMSLFNEREFKNIFKVMA